MAAGGTGKGRRGYRRLEDAATMRGRKEALWLTIGEGGEVKRSYRRLGRREV